MKSKRQTVGVLLAFCILFLVVGAFANSQELFNEGLLKGFTFRNLGPYRAGSWITDFAVPDSPSQAHLYTFYVGTRNGGVWNQVLNVKPCPNPTNPVIPHMPLPSQAAPLTASTPRALTTRSAA